MVAINLASLLLIMLLFILNLYHHCPFNTPTVKGKELIYYFKIQIVKYNDILIKPLTKCLII